MSTVYTFVAFCLLTVVQGELTKCEVCAKQETLEAKRENLNENESCPQPGMYCGTEEANKAAFDTSVGTSGLSGHNEEDPWKTFVGLADSKMVESLLNWYIGETIARVIVGFIRFAFDLNFIAMDIADLADTTSETPLVLKILRLVLDLFNMILSLVKLFFPITAPFIEPISSVLTIMRVIIDNICTEIKLTSSKGTSFRVERICKSLFKDVTGELYSQLVYELLTKLIVEIVPKKSN